jgi:hypothetical protein
MPVVKPDAGQLIARAEIYDALMRYLRGCDRKDMDLVRSAYFPDANHNHGDVNGTVEELVAWIASPTGGMHHLMAVNGREVERIPQVMHFIGNIAYEFASDTVAIVESYALTLQIEQHEDGSQTFQEIGLRYVDRFEKRDGEWRIADRVVPVLYATNPRPINPLFEAGLKNNPLESKRDRNDYLWEARSAAGLD